MDLFVFTELFMFCMRPVAVMGTHSITVGTVGGAMVFSKWFMGHLCILYCFNFF